MAVRERRGEGRESIVSVRLSVKEEKELKAAAASRGEPISSFLREAGLSVARPSRGGPSWSTKTATAAVSGTVIPRYVGTAHGSRPVAAGETTGAAAEPISRAR